MENAIKFLRIQNFKSIKDVTLHPRRVNLIIGEPNVGKSNLLEAMSLLGGITYEQTEKFMASFIRYEEPRQLFYDNLVGNTIKVETDRDVAVLNYDRLLSHFEFLFCNTEAYQHILSGYLGANGSVPYEARTVLHEFSQGKLIAREFNNMQFSRFIYTKVDNQSVYHMQPGFKVREWPFNSKKAFLPKPYTFFKQSSVSQETANDFLNPPNGDNLIEIIQTYPNLRKEIAQMFERYGQKLQLRMDERKLEIIKDQDGVIYSYPYSSVADTLQRIIFYLAAIESNDDAVLLFEEPEAHSFPVYVSKLGRRIVESRNNQFFIDTHSPYLIDGILEDMLTDDAQAGELAVFAAYYEDHQTKVHQLTDDEIRSIRNDSIDVFYNMKRFTTGRIDA
jgi:AAA15 family ATPase/GTPase